MKIAIDLRSLHTGGVSGVENYILNLLEHLLLLDHSNEYVLFYNSFKPKSFTHLEFVNSKLLQTRIPNRLLNGSIKLFGKPSFEKLIGDFDCIWLPNFSTFAVSPKAKLILTVHDLSPLIEPSWYSRKESLWYKFINVNKILKRADMIWAVSEFTKQDIINIFKISADKIKVLYPGVDRLHFTPNISLGELRDLRNDYSLPKKYILFLSTIEPRKNLIGLIKAFENLSVDCDLVIAGKNGYQSEQIEFEIKRSSKKNRIHVLGYVPESDKPGLIKLASVVCYPSFYEGFGFIPLEAMSMGTPVITSKVTSLPEVSGSASLLINPYDIQNITDSLKHLLTNKELRDNLVVKGFRQVENFSWEKSAQLALENLEFLVAKS